MLKIKLTSVFVDDQDKALKFYTDVLGFVKKHDIPMGAFKWVTLTAADNDDIELLLEPNDNAAAGTYQQAIKQQGIPATAFNVDDIEAEYGRLTELGVKFTMPPTAAGPVKIAVLDDTCGNLIQLLQV
jgi:predicted enzyme related to lactoylglutathione lyase